MRRLIAALPVLLLVLALPATALAHAQLLGTSPPSGTVKKEPGAVVFRFDQPVEGNFGAVRVYNVHGQRVDAGDAFHPNGTGSLLGVHLKPKLAEGTYTATYRVVSADGHVVSSGFVFSIGKVGVAPKQTVAQLISGQKTGMATEIVYGVFKGLQYAALAAAIGIFLFAAVIWIPALSKIAGGSDDWRSASMAFAERARRGLLIVAAVGAISAAGGVVMEAATAAGISGWSALRPSIIREELGTHFGTVWGLAVVGWLGVEGSTAVMGRLRSVAPVLRPAELGATGLARRSPSWMWAVPAALLGLLALVPAYAGHASTQHPVALLFPTNVAHVLAVCAWAGGLAALLFVVPAATRRLHPSDRARILAANLERFSPLALGAIGVILLTGLIQAYVYVRTLDNLISTAFGRAVLIKFILLIGLIALGAYNRRRSVPTIRAIAAQGQTLGRPGLLLRRALRTEVALIVVVFGVTAALTSYPPSIIASTGPYSTTRTLGPAQLQMTVDPDRVGSNQIHLYLINPVNGAQFTKAKEVDIAESMPSKSIGPLNQKGQKAGPGHYIVPGALLSVPGTWELDVTVRISAFNEYTTKVEVPVH